jgi:hypothetical protein
MNDPSMHELVDPGKVGVGLAVLSTAALVAAPLLIARGRRGWAALTRAGLIAAALIAVFPLWLVYNGIENHFGLDSVAALLLNLALFVLVGIGGGLALRRCWPQSE